MARKEANMWVVVSGFVLFAYVCLVLVDATCTPALTACELYEPFSPW